MIKRLKTGGVALFLLLCCSCSAPKVVTVPQTVKLLPPPDRLIEYEIPEFTGNTNGELWDYKDTLIQLLLRHNNDKRELKLWVKEVS